MPIHGHTSAELERLSALVGEFGEKTVLVIGDLMLDEFVWGKVSRISPEAPVPVVDVTGESYYPGGAANVARNLRSFGASTSLIGAIGDDGPGARLSGLLQEAGIETTGHPAQFHAHHRTEDPHHRAEPAGGPGGSRAPHATRRR